MIAVTVIATVVTQSLVVIGVFSYTDNKFDEYDDAFFFQKISRTIELLETGDQAQRELVLETSTSEEIKFLLTQNPWGSEPLKESFRAKELQANMPGYTILTSVHRIDIFDILGVLFGTLQEHCLVQQNSPTIESDCPHWTISVQLKTGSWLNITSHSLADSSVYLVPVLLSAFTSLIGIGGSIIVLARRITKPLRDLTEAAEQLGRGEMIQAIPEKGPVELVRTARVFNRMQERLSRFVTDRTTMLAAINHDLRTPLTSLRLRAEFIEENALREDMIETTEEMRTMVDSYLEFSRQEATEEDPQLVDLTEMLQALALESTNIEFPHQSSFLLSCRPVSIKRVFRNILDNGLKHGTEVRIELKQTPEQIQVEIYDNGPGIPADSFEEVFTPFLRLDSSRNVSEGNVGLGLSIARTIVRKHGGDITPFYKGSGFGMRISLPHDPRTRYS
ncbi:ATP-binding protein [Phaeobacter sp. 11ANDIMAR09]|uniref:ATP-binding protein n=1 Tax=Phaeobacter sp. 11ANDIMAR09 TaxID=1225647 RepID=UPI0006C87972|nr:ATP-binding protein [Phaeobacter sp. 11ANDIMAR09]